jgi:hypothetical protein
MKTRNTPMRFGHLAAVLSAVAVLATIAAAPASAQVRAAMVRDVDAPALAPVTLRGEISFTALNNQLLLATVPAGKRLVIEHASYFSAGQNTGELIFLALRNGQFGPVLMYAEMNRPHVSAASSLVIQEGSQATKTYFEAGQEVWLSASRNNSGDRSVTAVFTGYYVTP